MKKRGRKKKKDSDLLNLSDLAALESEEDLDEEDGGSAKKTFGKSHNHILGLLTKEIGTHRILERMELLNLSRDVEDLYSQVISHLAENTEYLEDVLAKNLADILAGITGGRVIHNIPHDEKDPLWGRNAEFVSDGLTALATKIFEGDRLESRQKFAEDFKNLKMVGSIIYNSIEEYCSIGIEYIEASMRMASCILGGKDKKEIREIEKIIEEFSEDLCTEESNIQILLYNIDPILAKIRRIHKFIFSHHSRLLIKVASSLTTESDQLLDNFQAGGFGLMRAIRDYAPPYNFIGYASSWIRQSILGNMRTVSNNIRVPGNILQEYSTLEKIKQTLPSDQQSSEDIAKAASQSPERVQRIYELINLAHTFSLDREIHNSKDQAQSKDSGPVSLQDIIPDEASEIDRFENSVYDVEQLFSTLTLKEKWVVANYYGLQDYLKPCDSEACKEMLIKETIRQLYVIARLKIISKSKIKRRREALV